MDVAFLITTYNRQKACQKVVSSLWGKGDIYVLNDGCSYTIFGAEQIKRRHNFGKQGYWKTVNQLFNLRGNHKYYIMLPDDWMPLEDMVEKAIDLWEGIIDNKKICLSLLYPGGIGRTNWTKFPAIDAGRVYKTQWVDMCFICEEKFFRELGVLPRIIAGLSSGVGKYISHKFNRDGYNLYQVKEELFIQQEEHNRSQMNNGKNNRTGIRPLTQRILNTRNQ